MIGERGTALLGTLVIGLAVLALVGQALLTIGRLSSAATATEETARYAAAWAARLGNAWDASRIAREMTPDGRVEVLEGPDGIAVVVAVDVSLVGPAGSPLSTTVTGRAVVPISEHRSRR